MILFHRTLQHPAYLAFFCRHLSEQFSSNDSSMHHRWMWKTNSTVAHKLTFRLMNSFKAKTSDFHAFKGSTQMSLLIQRCLVDILILLGLFYSHHCFRICSRRQAYQSSYYVLSASVWVIFLLSLIISWYQILGEVKCKKKKAVRWRIGQRKEEIFIWSFIYSFNFSNYFILGRVNESSFTPIW